MRILVAYDGSTSADAAIGDLRSAGLPEEAEARVVCGGDGCLLQSATMDRMEPHIDSDESSKYQVAEAETLAERASEQVRSFFPKWTVLSEALWGAPAKILLDTSDWWHPDLVVVGSHGRSRVARLFLG